MFWTELNKISSVGKQISDTVGNASGSKEIAQLFHDKYKALYNSVSTSEDELRLLRETLSVKLLSANTSSLDLVTPDLIKRCISKLKSGKGDGSESFTSDHLINSCSRLHSVLALLFQSIIYHGHYPDNLLKSTIISIPKDAKASLSNVDNYRGISLSNSINKVFDYVIIELYQNTLMSSDMQFAYKSQHSTALCSVVYLETLQYYKQNGSQVYSCLLDASKAFDRIHYGKLFNILISRKLPAFIIRVLFDSYSRQQSRAMWNSCYTDYFYMSNGVKQGSVLSAILFTIYIDSLLILLRDFGVGCKINNCYTGAISYADDITLSCPSIRGLNRMLDICNKFAAEHYLIFNSKKSLAIKYGKEVNNTEYVLLGQDRINWVDSVRHLGNYFNTQLSDITDCMVKRSTFIGSVNKLMANFGHLQAHVLCKIFKTFCCNFYGSPIWDINSPGFRKICITWNIGVRTVLKLPFDTHSYFLGPLLRQNHIRHQLQVRSIRFLYNMYYSNNTIVRSCFNHAIVNVNSCIGAKLAFLRTLGVNIFKHKLCGAIKHVPQSKITVEQQADIENLRNLMFVRSEQSFIEGFDNTDIDCMIQYITGH